MHYKDGTEVHIGDTARGKGLNLPYEVQGIVVGLAVMQDACGIHLAVPIVVRPAGTKIFPLVTFFEEHGNCSEFALIQRATGLAD